MLFGVSTKISKRLFLQQNMYPSMVHLKATARFQESMGKSAMQMIELYLVVWCLTNDQQLQEFLHNLRNLTPVRWKWFVGFGANDRQIQLIVVDI